VVAPADEVPVAVERNGARGEDVAAGSDRHVGIARGWEEILDGEPLDHGREPIVIPA
jgi:hypothetical protein